MNKNFSVLHMMHCNCLTLLRYIIIISRKNLQTYIYKNQV